MIAFNFNIHFQDESSLDDGIYDTSKEHIYIVRSTDPQAFTNLAVKSDYLPMSGREACYGAEKEYSVCQKGCQWGMDIKDVVTVVWRCGARTIEYSPQKEFTPDLLQFWVLHTILPIALTLEKCYDILHVGAVEVNGNPIVFSAESFGGKSTMTDYFIQQGHTMLSDDTLGLFKEDGQYMVVPSYPFHRPFREPESLGHKITNVTKDPKPLKAVFLLERAGVDAKVKIEEVKGIEKYKAFHFSTFINFDFHKAHRFQLLSDMAKHIPVYKVIVPWNIDRLNEVHFSIVKHTKQ